MLRELAGEAGLSQHELARRTGRDVSWVNRRLKLLDALSEELLEAAFTSAGHRSGVPRSIGVLEVGTPSGSEALRTSTVAA